MPIRSANLLSGDTARRLIAALAAPSHTHSRKSSPAPKTPLLPLTVRWSCALAAPVAYIPPNSVTGYALDTSPLTPATGLPQGWYAVPLPSSGKKDIAVTITLTKKDTDTLTADLFADPDLIPPDHRPILTAILATLDTANSPTVTLRQITAGAITIAPAADPTPAAWTVALRPASPSAESAQKSWQVFNPIWCTQKQQIGVDSGWIELPFTPAAGKTYYAILPYYVSASDLQITTGGAIHSDTADGYEDTPAHLPSDRYDTLTNGTYYYKIPIGKFLTDPDTGTLRFDQWHVGLIILDPVLPPPAPVTVVTGVTRDEASLTVHAGKVLAYGLPQTDEDSVIPLPSAAESPASGYCVGPLRIVTRPVTVGSSGSEDRKFVVQYFARITENDDGTLTLTETDKIAVEYPAKTHSQDHTDGVI